MTKRQTYTEWTVSFRCSERTKGRNVVTVKNVDVNARTAFRALAIAHRITGIDKATIHEATVTIR